MTQAVFLSYASQDADAARRICDMLRATGLEVWFDQSELRGGDAWDASIRKQIKECTLFVPIISASTDARSEGYFRLEWKLAVDRSHLMADDQTFFVPAILGEISEPAARVPDAFRSRQWSRLRDDKSVAAFAERIAKLVDSLASSSINALGTGPPLDRSPQGTQRIAGPTSAGTPTRTALRSMTGYKLATTVGAVAIISLGGYYVTQSKTTTSPSSGTSTDASKSAAINPLSIMVMPFANQTGDEEKAYIADALTSSITSDLTRIRDAFIVPAATAFSLADKKLTVPQLGKEAAVRFVLTGSVTGDKEKLRINAVLSDTQTGAQLWTQNFDGKQSDLFALQDQVTTRIGNTIGPQMIIVAARESEKRANKPQVADLLMRASALGLNQQSLSNHQAMEALYRETLALEPNNLTAKIGLAISLSFQAINFARQLKLDRPARIALAKQATDLAQEVLRADPTSGEVYLCIGIFANLTGDLEGAVQAGRRLVELQPKNSAAYSVLGHWLFDIGEMQQAKVVLEKSLQFAPPARRPAETYGHLARIAFVLDRADEAITLAQQSIDANPRFVYSYETLALAYARRGDLVRARKAAAEAVRLFPNLQLNIKNSTPWPGKEAAYRKYIETQYLPAWRLAGLPE